ncbi:MAG: hypothetical protein PT934_05840 [Peptoniphilaceae bacterium]|uniref:hypothetical protein n=1 Tax=Parvimonas sp. TaxID=1944660 RepID=UPI0025ED1786|nr:hypothetical protein [Parvimonas sp.]MCI5997804.1 hypothetical protein [Parvimonas sp.]MDD7765271.1 hypothetical protein [Peptoniphilaceae bacterium]MDY3051353.1 hypothetical protein [Parvimonas sp.]
MKRRFLTVIIFVVLFCFSFLSKNVLNADNFDRANQIFDINYKSFFIGTIVEDDGKKFNIEVNKVFLGEDIKNVEVKKFYEYSYSELIPQKGDYIVAILKKDDSLDLSWIFKTTSTDYKTLFLANDKDPNNNEVKTFQYLINEGKYIPDMAQIEKNRKKVENEGKELNKDEQKKVLDAVNRKDNAEYEEKLKSIYKILANPILLIVPGILFFAIYYVVRSRKNFLKEMEDKDNDEEKYY